jgi:hypothetical protein
MQVMLRQAVGLLVVGVGLVASGLVVGLRPAGAVEVGQPAPDFRLPSTSGTDVSLGDFRGKSWVLLEFYGADFVPT